MFTSADKRSPSNDDISTQSQFSLHSPLNNIMSPQSSASRSTSSSSTISDSYDLLAAYDNAIKSFCPNILLNEINTTGVEVRSVYFTGVCMLADISGFTKLSNELGKDGSDGLDRLRKATSGFLSKFIYLVYSYGGDVISFAGDALICIFRDQNGMPTCESKRKAIECGFKLKDHCTDQLSAHIAITTGEMCFALLGGYMNNWVYVLNGPCVQELSQCIDDAKSKELVISQLFYSKVPEPYRSQLEVSSLPSGNFLIQSVSQESVNQLDENICFADRFEISSTLNSSFTVGILGFLPTTVVSSMTAGSFRNISELRVVTTMFLKLDSYSSERNEDLVTLQSFFYMAQESIFLSGGVLRQFLVDDKGCVLIALWGVPSASYTNNGHRAILCATTIREKSKLMNHRTSIGITTGQCFCGTIGSILRRDYVAIGDSVNMSARLMSKANGRILLDEMTFSTLPISIRSHLRQGEVLNLKGRSVPLIPYTFRDNTNEGEGDTGGGTGGGETGTEPGTGRGEEEEGKDTLNPFINLNLMSLNLTGNKFTTKSTSSLSSSLSLSLSLSSSSDDNVFMNIPGPKAKKFFLDSKESSQYTATITTTTVTSSNYNSRGNTRNHGENNPLSGEQFENIHEKDYQIQSNLSPHIEKTLNEHIKHLLTLQSNILRPKTIQKSNLNSNSNSNFKCQLMSTQPFPLMRYVIVHGKQGTGKTEIAKYFRKLSLQNKIRCFYLKAIEDDLSLEYGVFRRLFISLIGMNVFKSKLTREEEQQEQRAVINLLKITYLNQPDKMIIKQKFPVIKDILGLHWDLESVNGTLVGVPEKKSVLNSCQNQRQCYFTKYKNNLIMSEIIRCLLMNIPSTIIIDDAHYCDTLTWRELSFITSADLPLVCLFTMRPPLLSHMELEELLHQETQSLHPHPHPHPQETKQSQIHSQQSQQPQSVQAPTRHKAMSKYGSMIQRLFRKENRSKVVPSPSSPSGVGVGVVEEQTLRHLAATPNTYSPACFAATVCQHLATSNPHGTLLTVDHLSREQISNILCCVLSRSDVLPDLVDIVQEVSIGNAFWVRSIADYVSQFGYDAFMKSVGVTSTCHTGGGGSMGDEMKNTTVEHTTSTTTENEMSSSHQTPSSSSHSSHYAITTSFRKYGSLLFVDKSLRKTMKKSDLEHESSHLRIFIVSLVDQLSVADSTVLKLASLIGVTFCSQVLKLILPQSFQKSGSLESSLLSLEERGFIIRISSEGTFYQFQNHRIREIVYDFTPPSDASRLHYAIAKLIEKIYCNTIELTYESLTYHYNNAISTDYSMNIYKEALKYSLLTASLFLRMGNFSLALDYLEYAETIAHKEEEYLQIMIIIKSAESIVNLSFSNDVLDTQPSQQQQQSQSSSPISPSTPPPSFQQSQHNQPGVEIAEMFYQHNTLGSNFDDFLYADYIQLYERIQEKIHNQEMEPQPSSSPSSLSSSLPPLTMKPTGQEITLPSSSSSMTTISASHPIPVVAPVSVTVAVQSSEPHSSSFCIIS